jgi:hypothetical protein
MTKSRRVKRSKKSTRRAGAKAAIPKFSSVVDACRKILKARTVANAEKFHAEALAIFPEISDVEKSSLDLCLNAVQVPELKEDAENAIADLESAPSRSSTPETVETELKTITPESSQEDMMMMDIDREPSPVSYREIEVREGGPMELDGGRKRRKTRRGGKKRKTTRRH